MPARTESANEAGQTVWLISRTVYDAAGRAVYATDGFPDGTPEPEITGTHTVYDEAGRVTTTQRLKGLVIDLAGTATNLSVDGIRKRWRWAEGRGSRIWKRTDVHLL